jgi:hypothetical protein
MGYAQTAQNVGNFIAVGEKVASRAVINFEHPNKQSVTATVTVRKSQFANLGTSAS